MKPLPPKLVPWYKYAFNFIATLKKKQPKVVLKSRPDESTKITTILFLSNDIEISLKRKMEPDVEVKCNLENHKALEFTRD